MLLHVETNQFSGFSFWLQYPMAEERTSAQTVVFRNTDGRNQISKHCRNLIGRHEKKEKKKKVREYRETTEKSVFKENSIFSFMPFLSIAFTFWGKGVINSY